MPRIKKKEDYACSDCVPAKPFSSSQSLKQHVDAIHLGVRYKCVHPGCTDDFSQPARLKAHVKIVHEGHVADKPYKCTRTGCKQSFKSGQELERHEKVHDKVRDFWCTVPGCKRGEAKPFSQKGHLTRHVNMVHNLERSHECTIDGCNRTFATADNLRQHLDSSLHKNVRPFKCGDCTLDFTQQVHLDKHVACVHLEQRPFHCTREGCTETFARREHLATHVHAVHKIGGKPSRKKSEDAMARFLTEHGVDFKREHHTDFKCTEIQDDHFARIDFLMVRNGVVILLENDERQHDWIETVCDVKRMAEVFETIACGGNTLPVVFIRFNPHDFRADGKLQHVLQRDRRMHLLNVLQNPKHLIYDKEQPLKIMHMFYDTCNGVPQVHKEYGLLLEACVPFTPLPVEDISVKTTGSAEEDAEDLGNWLSAVDIGA